MSAVELGTFYAGPRPVPLFRPQHNRHRRSFLSQRDAAVYDAGWRAYHQGRDCPDGPSPGWQGWMDAQGQHLSDCTTSLEAERIELPAAAPREQAPTTAWQDTLPMPALQPPHPAPIAGQAGARQLRRMALACSAGTVLLAGLLLALLGGGA